MQELPYDGKSSTYEFYIKDHLGNTRMRFKNVNNKAFVIEESDYFPFGLAHTTLNSDDDAYRYNGKVLNEELGLGYPKFLNHNKEM